MLLTMSHENIGTQKGNLVKIRNNCSMKATLISRPLILTRRNSAILLGLCLAALVARAVLAPETMAAYRKYIAELESRLQAQNQSQSGFLWIDSDPARRSAVRNGEIATQKIKAQEVPAGMIQHWIGGEFLPGVTLAQVEQVDQDYADYARIYAPDISRPKVLSHSGDNFVASYRITKTKVLTAVEDTVHAIQYEPLGPARLAMQSRSESVRQVADAGKPSEHVLPEGEGDGFLWAMNSYWRMEARDGGVYVECEAVTLSRAVPTGLGLMVNPILQSFAEDSLKKTLEAKRQAVRSKH
jgi:hypothetical protein